MPLLAQEQGDYATLGHRCFLGTPLQCEFLRSAWQPPKASSSFLPSPAGFRTRRRNIGDVLAHA